MHFDHRKQQFLCTQKEDPYIKYDIFYTLNVVAVMFTAVLNLTCYLESWAIQLRKRKPTEAYSSFTRRFRAGIVTVRLLVVYEDNFFDYA